MHAALLQVGRHHALYIDALKAREKTPQVYLILLPAVGNGG